MEVLHSVWAALVLAAAMAWQSLWSLVFGFTLSGLVAALVPPSAMRSRLGRSGPKEVALATAFGAASSSCSYAAAAMSRRIFVKGASLTASLAFLFSSTNLVIELGLLLLVLMGWQFMAAEWLGGLVIVAILAIIVRATARPRLIEAARRHAQRAVGDSDDDAGTAAGLSLWQKLRDPQTRATAASHAMMEFSMLRGDLIAGFLIAGAVATFVPSAVWTHLFVRGLAPALGVPLNAIAGAALAMITFVCSIGNVPMAAMLWGSGISFGGILAFLYADLIVIPLLDVYRKYYGWRVAAYLFGAFFVTIVASASLMDALFSALHWVPPTLAGMRAQIEHFSFDYTFWLNLIALAVAGYIVFLNRSQPGEAHCCGMHDHGGMSADMDDETVSAPTTAALR